MFAFICDEWQEYYAFYEVALARFTQPPAKVSFILCAANDCLHKTLNAIMLYVTDKHDADR